MTSTRVATKTQHLIREGKPAAQAYAIANAMNRAGRLTARGGYRRVSRGMRAGR